jgi:hypothetical protein
MSKIWAFGLLLLSFSAFGQSAPKSCVVVTIHRHHFGENMTRISPHGFYDYIEGDYPTGMKFRAEISKNQVREIQDKGGKVVVLRTDYQLPDLQDAREQCKAFQAPQSASGK